MTLTFKREHILIFFDAWWLIFVPLCTPDFSNSPLVTIFGFISLLCVPGLLTIFALQLRNLHLWTYLSLMIGFSLLELMVVGLLGNTLLPYFGIEHPLDNTALLGELTLFVGGLSAITWARIKNSVFSFDLAELWTPREWLFALLPMLFVILSASGAFLLNMGGSNILTLVMLVGIALYIAILLYWHDRLSDSVIASAIFFMALSLLLMTSLRSPYIIGHDIQSEYHVFQFAKQAGFWTIAAYRDAYNACMSITILPTIFSNLTFIADPYVYKLFFQILFATVPSMVYLIARRYIGKTTALIASVYFIAFPTFFTDMSFLNRQEIAFVFLALMFLIGFDEYISLTKRRILFTLFGIGMVLSHYSTTYLVLALFIFLIIARPILRWIGRFVPALQDKKVFITIPMVVILTAISFVWSSFLTDTSSNSIYRVVGETFSAIQGTLQEDARSGDVLYSFFSWKKVDPQALLGEYGASALQKTNNAPPGIYYDPNTYESYPLEPAAPELLPITPLGSMLAKTGIDVAGFNSLFRQLSAKILQLLVVVGIFAALFDTRYFRKLLDAEFVLMSGGSLLLLAAIIFLPILSVEYGLLRAFQQSLVFLSLFIAVGSLSILYFAKERTRLLFASSLAIIFFLSSTGVLTQALGGYDPQLHLNNSGTYFNRYWVYDSELQAVRWLATETELNAINGMPTDIQTDNLTILNAPELRGADISHDIYPGLVHTDAYVVLGVTNTTKQLATISYNGTQIVYTYPIEFLEQNKTLVYEYGDVKIYH